MTGEPTPVYEARYVWSPFQLFSGAWTRRLVAFRVDEQGVTLGGAPARYAGQTAFVPWRDIESVVLWQQHTTAPSPLRYVGVSRRAGAPQLPGPNAALGPEQTTRLAPHIDHEVFLASRHINLWTLDRERLTRAVASYAPGTAVRDVPNA